MNIRIIAVGKAHDKSLVGSVQDFEKRLQPQIKLTWELISPAALDTPDACRAAESNKIMSQFKPTDQVILLDERGQMPDNAAFATHLEQWLSARGQLVFVIGGAFGVDQLLRDRAQFIWSLSPLVFPHQIVRLLVVEQLYRAQAIRAGHPYHHV